MENRAGRRRGGGFQDADEVALWLVVGMRSMTVQYGRRRIRSMQYRRIEQAFSVRAARKKGA